MSEIKLTTKLPKGVVSGRADHGQAPPRPRVPLPSRLFEKPKDAGVEASKSGAMHVAESVASLRSELAEMRDKVSESLFEISKKIDGGVSSIQSRLSSAAKKVPLAFDVQRGADGRIERVIARPES